jgi:hypothetical protein
VTEREKQQEAEASRARRRCLFPSRRQYKIYNDLPYKQRHKQRLASQFWRVIILKYLDTFPNTVTPDRLSCPVRRLPSLLLDAVFYCSAYVLLQRVQQHIGVRGGRGRSAPAARGVHARVVEREPLPAAGVAPKQGAYTVFTFYSLDLGTCEA